MSAQIDLKLAYSQFGVMSLVEDLSLGEVTVHLSCRSWQSHIAEGV